MSRLSQRFYDNIPDDIWEGGRFACIADGTDSVRFRERLGLLYWIFKMTDAKGRRLKSYGQIPEEVTRLGGSAIRRYAEEKVRSDTEAFVTECERFDAFCREPNCPIRFDYELDERTSIALEGCIESTDGISVLQARLDKPHQGTESVHYSTMSHRMGHHIVDDETGGPPTFTSNAIDTAKQLLIEIYLKQKRLHDRRSLLDIVEKLDGGGEDR